MTGAAVLAVSGSTWQTVLVAVMLVLGYVGVFALWFFVFRERG